MGWWAILRWIHRKVLADLRILSPRFPIDFMVCTKCSKQRDQSYESTCQALQNMLAMLSWLPSPNATDSNVDDYPCCDNTAILQENLHISLPNIFDKLFATSSMTVKGLQTKSQAHVKLTFAHLNSHPAHPLVSSPINLTRILSPLLTTICDQECDHYRIPQTVECAQQFTCGNSEHQRILPSPTCFSSLHRSLTTSQHAFTTSEHERDHCFVDKTESAS